METGINWIRVEVGDRPAAREDGAAPAYFEATIHEKEIPAHRTNRVRYALYLCPLIADQI
jgi:hypothetical protein